MKEVISQRRKKSYISLLLLSIFSLFISSVYLTHPILQFVGIPIIVILSFATIVWTILLLDPRGVIERDGDTLIIRQGIRQKSVKISDVKSVERLPHQTKSNAYQDYCVSIQILEGGAEKSVICSDVADVNGAIFKITLMLGKNT